MREVFRSKRWLAAVLVAGQIVLVGRILWDSPTNLFAQVLPAFFETLSHGKTLRSMIEGEVETGLEETLGPTRRTVLRLGSAALLDVLLLGGDTRSAPPEEPQKSIQYLMTAAPSPELLKNLWEKLKETKPDSVDAKFLRVDFGVRIIQVDLMLGDKGSGGYKGIGIRPAQAKKALEAFQEARLWTLNDLRIGASRKILWDALGAAHPSYRFYVEGVRLAGHLDDAQVLESTLRFLESSWIKASEGRLKAEAENPFVTDWMREVLVDSIRFQAISNVEEAVQLTAGLKIEPPALIYRNRLEGELPFMTTQPAIPLRVGIKRGQQFSSFDRWIHRAAALQRIGCKVTFWSVAFQRDLNADTKTVEQEPLILFEEKEDGRSVLTAIGPEDVLASLKGEKVSAETYRFSSRETLNQFLVLRGQYKVEMKDVLEGNADPAAWSAAVQKTLEKEGTVILPRGYLLGISKPAPWSRFAEESAASSAVTAQSAFAHAVEKHGIRVYVTPVRNGETKPSILVENVQGEGKNQIFPAQASAVGKAMHLLPGKLLRGLISITLQEERVETNERVGVVQTGGEVVPKTKKVKQAGRAWAGRLMLATGSYFSAIHEATHTWAFARTEKFREGDWEGTLVDLFNEISWDKKGWDEKGDTWVVRGGKARLDDFIWEYGAVNKDEDLAVMGQLYSTQPHHFRYYARVRANEANFVLAAKYLYLRHIVFLDTDGKVLEYETDTADVPFTVAVFKQWVEATKQKQGKLTAEQQRLVDIVERIMRISQKMIQDKKITYYAPGAQEPLMADPPMRIKATLALTEEVSQKSAIVIEADAISRQVGLEEFVARLPRGLADQVYIFRSKGSVTSQEIRARNPWVHLIDSDDVADVARNLVGLEEARRIGYLGHIRNNADRLTRMLPGAKVTVLNPRTALLDILRQLKVLDAVPVDVVGLEEGLGEEQWA